MKRIWYIDNLRIILTFLVVAHHLAIAYGAPGNWYNMESNMNDVGTLTMSLFVAVNQAFFMGFFFFISAYLVPKSYDKKGGANFMKKRLFRLGIPLLFYFFIISPLLNYASARFTEGYTGNILEYLDENLWAFSAGPLWFVMMLIVFGFIYHILRRMHLLDFIVEKRSVNWVRWIPIILLLLIGLTYAIRIIAPVGDWIDVPLLGFQPAHVTQYIICFALGILAYRWQLLDDIKERTWKIALSIALAFIFIVFPAIFLLSGKSDQPDLFMGGGSIYSFLFAAWEQVLAVAMMIGLLGLFRRYWNSQGTLLKDISRSSYAIYVFHSVVLVTLFILFQAYSINTVQKFLILLFPSLLMCYLFAKFILMIPGVKRIL